MSEAHSQAGIKLVLTQGLGLGLLGLDHALLASEAREQGLTNVADQHRMFAVCKPGLLIGAVVVFLVLYKVIRVPVRDPIHIVAVLLALCWGIWAIHDYLWVICGVLLDYKYIFNINTKRWSKYAGFSKFLVLLEIFIIAVFAWHLLWFFSGQQ